MTLRTYLILFTLATVIAWGGWVSIIINVDPFQASTVLIVAFYVSLTVGLFGLFSLIGFFFRAWFSKDSRLFKFLYVSSRQGALLSILVTALLLLQANDYMRWWNIILLLTVLSLIEIFFTERKEIKT